MAHAAGIEQFEPFYLERLPKYAPRTIQCMHDVPPTSRRVPPAILQTAGSILGLGYDIAFMRAAMEHRMESVPHVSSRLAETLSVRGITAFLHQRGCGGETAMPDVAKLVAGNHPDKLHSAITSLGLNLPDEAVEQGIHTYVRYARDSSLYVPDQQLAATIVERGNTPVHRIDVDGNHLAGHVLVDHTGKPFDTRAAWDADTPAYNIGFGAMADVAVEAMGGDPSLIDDHLLLSVSALRHIVTAEAVLRNPEPGQELAFLIHA